MGNNDYIQEIISQHMAKITNAYEDIIKECLDKHFGLPLTEETYKRITKVYLEDEPRVERLYLDSEGIMNAKDFDPKNFIALFDYNQDFELTHVNEQPKYYAGFKFKTAYKNSKFVPPIDKDNK